MVTVSTPRVAGQRCSGAETKEERESEERDRELGSTPEFVCLTESTPSLPFVPEPTVKIETLLDQTATIKCYKPISENNLFTKLR